MSGGSVALGGAGADPGGWTCTYCGAFVPWYQSHSCPPAGSAKPEPQDRLAAAAERIAVSLERLVEWLAT